MNASGFSIFGQHFYYHSFRHLDLAIIVLLWGVMHRHPLASVANGASVEEEFPTVWRIASRLLDPKLIAKAVLAFVVVGMALILVLRMLPCGWLGFSCVGVAQ